MVASMQASQLMLCYAMRIDTCLCDHFDVPPIRKNLMDNHGEPVIYDFADFMYVLDVGLETDYFGALPQYDFGAVLTGIEINF